jgi:Ca2+-binding RTX toxin-like protein
MSIINGTEGNDTIIGGFGDNLIIGNGGDDYIASYQSGIFGNNFAVYGGSGNDTIDAFGTAPGTIIGGDGNDVISNYGPLAVIHAGAGLDLIFCNNNGGEHVQFTAGSGRDYVLNFNFAQDSVQIDTLTFGYNDYQDLLAHASIYQDETSAVIEFDTGDFLIFNHTDVSLINPALFSYGAVVD